MLGGLFLLILKLSGRILVYSNPSKYSWKRQVLQGRETDALATVASAGSWSQTLLVPPWKTAVHTVRIIPPKRKLTVSSRCYLLLMAAYQEGDGCTCILRRGIV